MHVPLLHPFIGDVALMFLLGQTYFALPRPLSGLSVPLQVMVSRFVVLNPCFTSVLMTLNMEPASNTVSHFLSAPSPRVFCLSVSLSLSQKNSEAKNILKQLHQSTCLLALYPPLHGKVHFTDWKRLKPSCGPSNESLFRKQVIMLLFHGQDTMAIS